MVAHHASHGSVHASSHFFSRKALAVMLTLGLSAGLLPAGTALAAPNSQECGTIAGVSSIMFAPDAQASFKAPSSAQSSSSHATDVEKVMDSLVAANAKADSKQTAALQAADDSATPEANAPAETTTIADDETPMASGIDALGIPDAQQMQQIIVTPVETFDEFKDALKAGDTNIIVTAEIAITEPVIIDHTVSIDLTDGALNFSGPDARMVIYKKAPASDENNDSSSAITEDVYVNITGGAINGEKLWANNEADEPASNAQNSNTTTNVTNSAGAEDSVIPMEAGTFINVHEASLVLDDTQITVAGEAKVILHCGLDSTARLINGSVISYDGSGTVVQTEGTFMLNSAALFAHHDATALNVGAQATVSIDATSQVVSQDAYGVIIDGGLDSKSISFNCVGIISGVTPIAFGDNVQISNGTFPFKIDSAFISPDVTYLIVLDNNFLYTTATKSVVMNTAPTGSKVYPVINSVVNWSNETIVEDPTQPTEQPITPAPAPADETWSNLEVVTPTAAAPQGTNSPLNSTAVTTTVAPVTTTIPDNATPMAGVMTPGISPVTQYLVDDATPLAQGLMNSGALFGAFSDPEGTDLLADSSLPFRGGKSSTGALGSAEYAQQGISWIPFIIGAVLLVGIGVGAVVFVMKRRSDTAALVALLDEEEGYYFDDPYDYY